VTAPTAPRAVAPHDPHCPSCICGKRAPVRGEREEFRLAERSGLDYDEMIRVLQSESNPWSPR